MDQEVPARLQGEGSESQRLSVPLLVGLAAGGLIGSGWFSASASIPYAGRNAVWAWIVGGVIMLALASIMIELSIFHPTIGQLIFSPSKSSGPLVATMVGATLWLAYSLNSAAEAQFMAREAGPGSSSGTTITQWLTSPVLWVALGYMALILAINLLPPDWFVKINLWLIFIKITIPVLAIILLWPQAAKGAYINCANPGSGGALGISGVFSVLIVGGIVFSYTGFQAPMDLAGDIREDRIRFGRRPRPTGSSGNVGEDANGSGPRLRLAVYATVVVGIALYALLQQVFNNSIHGHCNPTPAASSFTESPYIQYASHVGMGWFAYVLRIDAFLSPLGAGIVYSYALTREVATFSQQGFTAAGLEVRSRIPFPFLGRTVPVYWRILLLNLVVGLIGLVAAGGNWITLTSSNSTLNLFLYSISCIVFIALLPKLRDAGLGRGWSVLYRVVARIVFAAVALTIYWSSTGTPRSMIYLATGCSLLLVLPLLQRWHRPGINWLLRRYMADAHATLLWGAGGPDRRPRYEVRAAIALMAFLAVLTVLNYLKVPMISESPSIAAKIVMSVAVAVIAEAVFEFVVHASQGYMNR
jgi:amino acid transporter